MDQDTKQIEPQIQIADKTIVITLGSVREMDIKEAVLFLVKIPVKRTDARHNVPAIARTSNL